MWVLEMRKSRRVVATTPKNTHLALFLSGIIASQIANCNWSIQIYTVLAQDDVYAWGRNRISYFAAVDAFPYVVLTIMWHIQWPLLHFGTLPNTRKWG